MQPATNRHQLVSGLGWALLLMAAIGAIAATPRRVLVVHSFGSAAPPFTTASTSFESTLAKAMDEPVDLDEVSLDVARNAALEKFWASVLHREYEHFTNR